MDQLRRAIHALDAQRALVFLNFGRRLDDTASKLSARGMPVGALHGELTKGERAAVLSRFRAGELRALLVTDLAARGLDVPECDAVFNLELPTDGTHYAHRAGRTGRLGRPGIVRRRPESSLPRTPALPPSTSPPPPLRPGAAAPATPVPAHARRPPARPTRTPAGGVAGGAAGGVCDQQV